MLRTVTGVVVATLAAPFVFLLQIVLFERFGPLASGSPPAPFQWRGFDALLLMLALLVGQLTLLVLPVAGLVAYAGRRLGWRALSIHLLGGSLTGLLFSVFVISSMAAVPMGDGPLLLFGLVTGAVCGWIYWLIAVRPRPGRMV